MFRQPVICSLSRYADVLSNAKFVLVVICVFLLFAQVSGQAQYTDDVPLPPTALHAAFVTSTRPHAKLLSVDATAAIAMPGVLGYFDAKDVPGDNHIGPIMHDEEVFATETVTCVGQVRNVLHQVLQPNILLMVLPGHLLSHTQLPVVLL